MPTNGARKLAETPVADPTVPRLELHEWAERYGLVAGITTRGSGAPFSLGLSRFQGEQRAAQRARLK